MANPYLLYGGLFQSARMHYFKQVVKKASHTEGARLLDYGCGPGDMLIAAKEFGLEAHGVDNFQRSVEMAKERGLEVELADSKNLPYPKEHFDIIFSQSVLEHVKDPVELVEDLLPYLKENGSIIVSSPTPGPYFWDDPTHIRPYTPKSFATLADICSLKVIDISYVFAFMLGLSIKNSIFYRLMNLIPISLGSNIIGVFQKSKS